MKAASSQDFPKKSLDARVRILWWIELLPLLIPSIIFLGAVYFFFEDFHQLPGMVLFTLLFIITLAVPYKFIQLKYENFLYSFRQEDLLIKKGIIDKVRYVIPYDKIQNVTSSRNAVENILGLSTIHIETAAHLVIDDDIKLPGIAGYELFIKELMEKVKHAQTENKEENKSHHGQMIDSLKHMENYLKEVHTSLASINSEKLLHSFVEKSKELHDSSAKEHHYLAMIEELKSLNKEIKSLRADFASSKRIRPKRYGE